MADSEPIQCPVCGWTGRRDGAGGTGDEPACPTCGEALGGG